MGTPTGTDQSDLCSEEGAAPSHFRPRGELWNLRHQEREHGLISGTLDSKNLQSTQKRGRRRVY